MKHPTHRHSLPDPVTPEWRPATEAPAIGRRIIALYHDGSGAACYYVHDGGLIDADGDDAELSDMADLWAYLPRGFKLWCERRADDPLSFPEVSDPSEREAVVPLAAPHPGMNTNPLATQPGEEQ